VFHGSGLDRDLDAEVRAHLDMAADEYMRRGYPRDAARQAARRAFGDIEPMKEAYRDLRGLPVLDALRQDVRYGVRACRRTPIVTAVVVLSLALAVGANTAVFAVLNGLMLRPLPIHAPEDLVIVDAQHNAGPTIISFPMYRDLEAQQQVFTGILATAGETPVRLTIEHAGAAPLELDNMRVSFVTGNYFDVLGVAPAVGRFFTPDEDRNPNTAETAGSVIVLSDAFWARQLDRDPGVVGQTVLVGRARCTVIGVTPPGFAGEAVGYSPVGWVPIVPFTGIDSLTERTGTFTSFMARLKPRVTREQAEVSLTPLFQQLLAAEGRVKDDVRSYRVSLKDGATGLDYAVRRTFSRPLLIIMAIVATVLLIACTNVANLLLARAAARRGEIGIRLAIGCSRGRLVAQLLTESLLLSLAGAAAGLGVAYWGSAALLRLVSVGPIPIALDVRPDLRVLAFLVATALVTGFAFGLLPALRATRIDVAPALKSAGRGEGPRTRHRLSRALVTCQVALSLLLLIGAGLLIRTLRNFHDLDWGFRPEHVLIFDLAHSPQSRQPDAMASVADATYHRIKTIPGIESASVSGLLLFSPSDIGSVVSVPGFTPVSGEQPAARFNSVSPDYFTTVGMTLVKGRGIEERDTFAAPLVAVVNEMMERRYFAGAAVGRVMQLGAGARKGKPVEIVGVVRDARYNNLRDETKPMFYVPIVQVTRSLRSLEVRTSQPAAIVAPQVRAALASVTKDIMIRRVISLTDQVDQSLAGEQMIMKLSTVFGALALLLACVGLYGVMSYTVSQRTSEIGIRTALGATASSVQWLVLRQMLVMLGAGIAIGIPLALAASRLVSGLLYGLSPGDPLTMLGATIVLGASAGAAAYVPARRAARVDPLTALRYE
jgi:predicted permease